MSTRRDLAAGPLKRTSAVPTPTTGPYSYVPFHAQQSAAANVPLIAQRNVQKRRAATAAVVKKELNAAYGLSNHNNDSDSLTIHAGLQTNPPQRPHSGPQVSVGLRPRIPTAVAHAPPPAQLVWTGVTVRDATVAPSSTTGNQPLQSIEQKTNNGVPISAAVSGVPVSTVSKRLKSPLSTQKSLVPGVGRPKARVSSLAAPSIVPFANRVKQRIRPPLATQLQNLTAKGEQMLDSIQAQLEHTTISPASMATAAAAASSASAAANAASRRPPGAFDPFELMYPSTAADHLLSVSSKRFIVGKLTCKFPSMVHFKNDRVCYMFHHPYAEATQIMMEMHYNDMTDLRCAPAGGSGAFSFKIPHYLPAFDGYGDYEPQLRNHRLTIEFNSNADLGKFKQVVYPSIQQQAIPSRR